MLIVPAVYLAYSFTGIDTFGIHGKNYIKLYPYY